MCPTSSAISSPRYQDQRSVGTTYEDLSTRSGRMRLRPGMVVYGCAVSDKVFYVPTGRHNTPYFVSSVRIGGNLTLRGTTS